MWFSTIEMQIFSYLCIAMFVSTSLAVSMSKQGCDEKCGKVPIPYPFGIGSNCSANSSFTIICQNSTTPILSSIKMEVLNVSLLGVIVVKQPVSPVECSSVHMISQGSLPISLEGSPFTISARYNSLAVLGCRNSVWLGANKTFTVGGCTAICDANSTERSCNGINCCQTTIPPRLKEVKYTYKINEADINNNSFCGYVFPVEKKWLDVDYKSYEGLFLDKSNPFDRDFGFSTLVLEWEFGKLRGYSNGICAYADDYCTSYPDDSGRRFVNNGNENCTRKRVKDHCDLIPNLVICRLPLSSFDNYLAVEYYYSFYSPNSYGSMSEYASSTKYCSCPSGYEGNPYLPEGCIDIDECMNETVKICGTLTCTNIKGSYHCTDMKFLRNSRASIALFSIGSLVVALILLLVPWKLAKAIRRRIKANRKHKFYKRNGGLLLEQQLSATNEGLGKTKLYTSKELAKATDHYNENRILGCGGQSTVYKGMLPDGRIVAVKKSKRVEEGDLQVFINEVVILSELNHRNVVKLLGCCLETEVPLLVYEFIPNGTLYNHIHEPSEEFPLSWEMRVRIAREVAGALAYLHSAASTPVYHRDIKSTNILLDDKYHAKVSDFGTSRSIAIDQTHLTTRVLGTFGYFDPEYFQSSQFTDKSDVYSFGVVMVELLTGEKAVTAIRVEEGIGLATHFLESMERNQLFDILDERVLKEGKRGEIEVIAELARRCLHLNGKRRPTMTEVAAKLEAIQISKAGSSFVQNCDDWREWSALAEVAEAQCKEFTSMRFDTISPSSTAARPLINARNGGWDIVGEYYVSFGDTPLGFARNGELLLFGRSNAQFESLMSNIAVFDSTTGELKNVLGSESNRFSALLFELHQTSVKHKLAAASASAPGEQGKEDGLTIEAADMMRACIGSVAHLTNNSPSLDQRYTHSDSKNGDRFSKYIALDRKMEFSDDVDKPNIFLYGYTRGNTTPVLTPISLEDDGSLSVARYSIKPPFEYDPWQQGVYCSNGLFCYPVGDALFVWNPTTSETRKLPDSPTALGLRKINKFTATWADPDEDNYKVIRFYSYTSNHDDTTPLEIELYSQKTDSWKKLIFSEDLSPWGDTHCYINGVLHMIPNFTRRSIREVLLSFDFRTENFSTSSLPDVAFEQHYEFLNYNGHPSLLFPTPQVNDHERIQSHYVFRNGGWDVLGEYYVNLGDIPKGFARNGELLLFERLINRQVGTIMSNLAVFDSTTGELKNVVGSDSNGLNLILFELHQTSVKLKPAAASASGEQGKEDGLTIEE